VDGEIDFGIRSRCPSLSEKVVCEMIGKPPSVTVNVDDHYKMFQPPAFIDRRA
jgi:hypothetical protein